MSSYVLRNAEIDTDIYYLNLSARAYNALKRYGIYTIREFLLCTEDDLYNFRSLGTGSVNEILGLQEKVRTVIANKADLNDTENYLIFCALNRSKIICYFKNHCDQPVSDLPFSTNLINRLYLAGYRKLSQIVLNIPKDTDGPMWGRLEKISSVSRYYLREEQDGILEYLSDVQLNTIRSSDQAAEDFVNDENADLPKLNEERKSGLSPETSINSLSLSLRSKNALMRNGIMTLGELFKTDRTALENIRGLGALSIEEILTFISGFLASESLNIANDDSENNEKNDLQRKNAYEEYVRTHDFEITTSSLPTRAKNVLAQIGITTFSELQSLDLFALAGQANIGKTSINAIRTFINETNSAFMSDFNECYVDGHYTSEYIQKLVLLIYRDVPFKGFSYRRIKERLPELFSDAEIKQAIGKLIAANELEYVDFRCYKVYPSFYDYLDKYLETVTDERTKLIIREKYNGKNLREIGDQIGVTHERIRQIIAKEIRKLKHSYQYDRGYEVFDEDYYQYIWENYLLSKEVCTQYLGISEATYRYLKESYLKGVASLEGAVNDETVDTALKLKIISYLNKDKIEIDGQLFEKKRSVIEDYVVSEYCKEETHIEEFFVIYNDVLKKNNIPFDDSLVIDSSLERTREARIAASNYVLWKEGRTFRYYNIQSNDYSDLLEALNLSVYKNTEVSTLKFIRDYPELMNAYDIRDQYELHNLLRKVVDPSTCNEIDFNRTPVLKFGNFDRDAAVYELICAFSPVSLNDLVEYIHDEYGHSKLFIQMNILSHFSDYYHKGFYTVDFQRIPENRVEPFKNSLTDCFYYISEIQEKYTGMFEDADENDINPYSLKGLGFVVNSKYVIQHFESARDYFVYELMKHDVYDISIINEKYGSIRIFEQSFIELKKSFDIFEFDRNQFITINRLRKLNVSKEDIKSYIDSVYEFVENLGFFTITSLKNEGFSSSLDDLGLNEYFYWNLLAQDERFNARRVSDSAIIGADIPYNELSTKAFLLSVLDDFDSVDPEELLDSIRDEYGLKLDKQDVLNAVRDTDKYYDPIMDKVYRNKMFYYDEFED